MRDYFPYESFHTVPFHKYDVLNARVKNQMRMMPTRFYQHLRRSALFTSKVARVLFSGENLHGTQDVHLSD